MPLSRLIVLACWLLPAGFAISSAWVLWQAHWPGVYVDMWDELAFLQRLEQGRSTAMDWFNAYAGSHRLLLPRLVFAVEHLLFRHGNVFTLLVALLFHALAYAGLVWLVLRDRQLDTGLRHLLLLSLAATAASALHLYNLLYPFLVQWFQVMALGLLAISLLVQARHHQGRALGWRLSLTLLLAGLASLCNASGILLLPALVVAGLLLRLPQRAGWWLAAACLLIAALHAATPTGWPARPSLLAGLAEADADQRLLAALALGRYLLRFLGMPLTLIWEPAGMALGAGLLIYTLWHSSRWLWRGNGSQSDLALIALTGLIWLCANAAAIAYGRGLIPVTAVAERFHTLHLWPWLLLLTHLAATAGAGQPRRWLWLPAGLWLLAVLLPLQVRALDGTLTTAAKVRMAHIAYSLNLRDWRTHALLSIPHKGEKRNPALDWRDYLVDSRNGFFARPEAHWPGQALAVAATALPACSGHLQWKPVDDRFAEIRITPDTGPSAVQAAWLLDSRQRVVGFALPLPPARWPTSQQTLAGYTARTGVQQIILNPRQQPCRFTWPAQAE